MRGKDSEEERVGEQQKTREVHIAGIAGSPDTGYFTRVEVNGEDAMDGKAEVPVGATIVFKLDGNLGTTWGWNDQGCFTVEGNGHRAANRFLGQGPETAATLSGLGTMPDRNVYFAIKIFANTDHNAPWSW